MAESREVFTILEDNSTAAGVKLAARAEGDAAGGNHVPSVVAKDSSGNYKLIEVRDAGDAAAGVDSVPVLSVKDLSGNLQAINARDEGDAISGVDALPALIAKDPSGNFIYLKVNADGELVISDESIGTKKFIRNVQVATVSSFVTVADITLTASKVYEKIQVLGSATSTTLWEVVGIEDESGTPVETALYDFITGPGMYSFQIKKDENIEYTAGTTGTLVLRVRGKQLIGAATDLHATMSALEKA
jgi:hypothetical protein